MGMPKGLAKATNYYNRIAAWDDWRKIAAEAKAAGLMEAEIAKHAPAQDAGWRKIDKHIAKLREAIAARRKDTA